MKKIAIFFMLALLCVSLCACNKEDLSITTNTNSSRSSQLVSLSTTTSKNSTSMKNKGSTSKKKTVNKESSSKTATISKENSFSSKEESSSSEKEDFSYLYPYEELQCRTIPYYSWQAVQINNISTGIKLELQLPKDWSLSKSGADSLHISRSGQNIGIITSDQLPEPEDDYDLHLSTLGNTEASTLITQYTQNDKTEFYHNFEFSTTVKGEIYKTSMRVNYTELDQTSAYKITDNILAFSKENFFVDPAEINGSKRILILGNSFISSSKIGGFLGDMLNTSHNGYTVEAVSIGMAQVTTFIKRQDILDSIAKGKFCYLYMCGFYSYESVAAVETIKNICESSNTQLVIFPAHNENLAMINLAIENYDDIPVLNWKNEVNALINGGVNYNDFCVNDSHKHSTPLAGYVGAHMIYRTLFKTTPPVLTYNAPLSEDFVKLKLEDYISSGGKITNKNLTVFEIE